MVYNPHKHHRHSIRLKNYDYTKQGFYFITICTNERNCLFGDIIQEKIYLNQLGKIVEKCWCEIPKHYPNVILHEYTVMPNHIDGIIEIFDNDNVVEAQNSLPLLQSVSLPNFQKMIPKSIGAIIRGFKLGVTKLARINKLHYTV